MPWSSYVIPFPSSLFSLPNPNPSEELKTFATPAVVEVSCQHSSVDTEEVMSLAIPMSHVGCTSAVRFDRSSPTRVHVGVARTVQRPPERCPHAHLGTPGANNERSYRCTVCRNNLAHSAGKNMEYGGRPLAIPSGPVNLPIGT